jgi:choline dehydrogenase-like flavoprotein
MIRQGHELVGPPVVRERCDVAIIGSGCGGATTALALAERGLDVVIVEAGGYYAGPDFDQREDDMLAKLDGGRGLEVSRHSATQLSYGNNVGGASVHYWADSYRTPPDRLALWSSRFGLEGHDLRTLEPHFARIERDLSVHPAEEPYVNTMNRLLREAATRLGWLGGPVPQARKGCVQSGYCTQGCRYDAKQSQLVTTIPRALALGARLYADCRARVLGGVGWRFKGLSADVLDRATGRPTGTLLEVEAKAIVVAAGGYETPAFLIRQGFGASPHLGEHFFCNPCPMVHALFPHDVLQWTNIPCAWGVEQFRLARHGAGSETTSFFGTQGGYEEGGYLLMANQLQPALLAATLPGVGPEHERLMKDARRLGGTIAWIDDADEGRITVHNGKRQIIVPLDRGNERRIRDAFSKQATVLFEAGASEVLFGDARDTRITDKADIARAVEALDLRPARTVLVAPHPGGGARMSAGRDSGVVGFDHRVHDTDNLYVTDPSVFPSPPSVDPSMTIMAFSHVAAGHIADAVG